MRRKDVDWGIESSRERAARVALEEAARTIKPFSVHCPECCPAGREEDEFPAEEGDGEDAEACEGCVEVQVVPVANLAFYTPVLGEVCTRCGNRLRLLLERTLEIEDSAREEMEGEE